MRRVAAFGSRATWTAKEYSDLDLAVLGDEPLSLDAAAALAEGFGESDLPFKVDVVAWADIDDHLRDIIRRDAVDVQAPETGPASTPGPPSSADRLCLSTKHRRVLEALLREHLPDVEVWVYGTRVQARCHTGRDLDLVLRGPGLEKIPTEQLADFADAVRKSTIPFLVEARDWARLPERFRWEIERDHGVPLVLPSAATTDDWLYVPSLPAHWRRRPLYSMAQWVNGLAFRDIQFCSTGRPVIKIAEIKGGISGQTKFTNQTFDDSVRVRPGDLLFAWSGQPESSINAFWWRGTEGWLNQHVFRVTPCPDIDKTFLFYLLRYLRPNFVAIAHNKQTTGLGHVTKQDLQRIRAAAPSPDEQRAIAHVLGTLGDKIELKRCMNETLETIAQTLFKSWFVDFEPVRAKAEGRDTGLPRHMAELFPDKMIDLEYGEVPYGWHIRPLADLIDVNPRRQLRKGQVAPFLDMANMPTRGHVPNSIVRRPFGSGMRFTNGDTLIARITPCLENGKTAYVDFLPDGETGWGSTEYIVMRPRNPLPYEFAYLLARSSTFRDFAIQNMTGTSGRQRVQASAVKEYQLAQPTERVAVAFGDLVRPLISRGSASARESRSRADLRDTLLPKLISGEIRVQEAEKTVVDAL